MSKKVSTKTMETLLKENTPTSEPVQITYTLKDGVEIKFNVKTDLSIEEKSAFIDRVVNSVLIDSIYHVEYFEPLFDISILQLCTDIPVFKDGENLDIEKTYLLCKALNIKNQVKDIMGVNYIEELYEDTLNSLNFKKQQIITQSTSLSDDIVLRINSVLDGINELLDSVKTAVVNFDPSQYKDIMKLAQTANTFGITKEDFIDGIIKNLPKKDVKTNTENITPIPSPTEDK